MRHVGVITKTTKFTALPIDAHCSCATGGHFKDVDSAKAYLSLHASRLGTADTFELVDNVDKPEPEPVSPVSKPFVNDVTLAAEAAKKAEEEKKQPPAEPTKSEGKAKPPAPPAPK
jgi:hypothetical protein